MPTCSSRRRTFIESFNNRVRTEFLNSQWFRTLLELQIKSHDWMHGYNTTHAHSALGYLTPEEFLATYETIPLPQESVAARRVRGQGQNYEPVAINTFLQVADYYLVTHAMSHNHVVVTHEVPQNTLKIVQIPNACIGVGVKFVTPYPYEMLRAERANFILGR